ncbi:iron(III) transport system ATP-binding protein [Ensifer adhaerens]|uniref:Iron(III) transport system ATP-binding protein n=1 Tax=Ensifer adhaerens TaxID=106592 RepID=A0ACC5SX12_ENSAD|nr:ABC transporter ATP-binding protein [Ensifer adhaerens]MBP1872939.1 iron(III) transport system ATP-binding protein [Ensifer adhaerens]
MTVNINSAALAVSPAKAISISDVNLYYGALHVLKDINLEIQPGEFFAFLGPSGCGKTTLLRLIAGFNEARQGKVVIGGQDVLDMPAWKRDVGMVFQSYALWPHMTVAANVAFGLEERRLPRAEVERRVQAALELVGLKQLADRRPSQLSGGQQQRVALARTIAIEPKVLLLDEPLSNLDAKMRVEVRRELRELQQRLKLTTIFVTHDQEEANTVCDRIAVFNEGRIQQVGTPMGLYEKPANLFVANFLGTANILDGTVSGSGTQRTFEVAGAGSIPIPAGASVPAGAKLVFRPQYATLGTLEPGAVALTGTIAHREFLGATVRYGVQVGTTTVLIDAPFHSGEALLETGATTMLGLKPSSALWLAE